MDYTHILQELQSASLFDLYRLRVAIDQQLDHPARVEAVRARLRPGTTIRYFDERENRLVEATVLELNRTRLLVENREDRKRWSILFCFVNLDDVPVDLSPGSTQKPLDRSLLRVGDRVGFRDRQNREQYGHVVSLNPKTAAVLTNSGHRWRVAYEFLFRVLDGTVEDDVIDGNALLIQE